MALFPTAQNPNKKRKASLFSVLGGDVLNQRQPMFGESLATSALPVKNPVPPLTTTAVKPLAPPVATTPQGRALADAIAAQKPVTAQAPPTDQPTIAKANPNMPVVDPLAKGGTPTSTVPADPTVQNPPALPPKPGETPPPAPRGSAPDPLSIYGNPSADYPIQDLITYDTQFLANPPASVQSDTDKGNWNDAVRREMENFKNEMATYSGDQYGKIFENHRRRMEALKTTWDTQGKYNSQIDDMLAQAFPGLKVSVSQVPEAQQNAFYQQAIAALQAGKSPQEIAGIYKAMFPAGYVFSIGAVPGATKENIDKYVPVGPAGVTQSGADIGKTDTSGINTTGQTETGAKVTQAEIDALNKELGAQPLTEDEKNKILAGDFAAIDADKQAAIRAAVSSGAAAGFGTNLASIVGATAGTAQKYDTQKAQMRGELTRQNLAEVQARRSAAITGLGEVAAREAGVAGTQAQAGLGAAGIESQENIQRGQLQLAKDSLFQEGQLTSTGQQINQQLQAYGFSLDKVLADQNFNLDNFKNQLQEKIVNQTGDIEAAKLKSQEITDSIKFAMDETQIDNQRNAQLAELQLRAAQGDQQAKLDVQQLQVEQELRGLDLANDYADRLGGWLMDLLMGREKLSQEKELFLAQLQEQAKQANKDRTANMIGNIIGGGLSAAGSYLGRGGG